MRIILMLALTTLSFAANANLSTVKCTFENHPEQGYIEFQGFNIYDPEQMELNWEAYVDYDGWETAYTYSGEELEYIWLWLVGDGGSVSYTENKDMEISIDSDGCDVGKIHRYANNGYKFGYMSVTHRCSPEYDDEGKRTYPGTYTKVACEVNTEL